MQEVLMEARWYEDGDEKVLVLAGDPILAKINRVYFKGKAKDLQICKP